MQIKSLIIVFSIILLTTLFLSYFTGLEAYGQYSYIPPTPAYAHIKTQNATVNATDYDSKINFIGSRNIEINGSNNGQNIFFTLIGTFMNFTATTCNPGQFFYKVNTTGFFFCTTNSGNENTTVTNLSGGLGITTTPPSQVGGNIKLKSIACSSGLSCSTNSTTNIITDLESSGNVPESQVVYPYLTGIGNYTQPINATSSSSANGSNTIIQDGTSQTAKGTYNSNSEDDTITITIGNNPNRMIIVGLSQVMWVSGGPVISSVKIGAIPFTQAVSSSVAFSEDTEMWYLKAPPTGVQTITIHCNNCNGNGFVYGATSLYNVDQAVGIGATATNSGSSTLATTTITPTNTGAWIMDSVSDYLATTPGTPSNIQLYNLQSLQPNFGAAQYNPTPIINNPNSLTWTYSIAHNWVSAALEIIPATSSSTAFNAVDNNLSTEWKSQSETHPWIYVDMGSPFNYVALAIYPDLTNSNGTQIEIDTSPDKITWNKVRTVNTNLLSNGTWNFIRWNPANTLEPRALRIYDTDSDHRVLAIVEIKVLLPTTWQLITQHGHKLISSTDGTIPLNS